MWETKGFVSNEDLYPHEEVNRFRLGLHLGTIRIIAIPARQYDPAVERHHPHQGPTVRSVEGLACVFQHQVAGEHQHLGSRPPLVSDVARLAHPSLEESNPIAPAREIEGIEAFYVDLDLAEAAVELARRPGARLPAAGSGKAL